MRRWPRCHVILLSLLWWWHCFGAVKCAQVKDSWEWNSCCLHNTLSFPSKKVSTCISSSCLRQRCAEMPHPFLIPWFLIGMGDFCNKGVTCLSYLPRYQYQFWRRPGWRRKIQTFSFFIWLFNVSKIYLLIIPFPFPTSQELFLTVFFLKNGEISIFSLFRRNQFCKSK